MHDDLPEDAVVTHGTGGSPGRATGDAKYVRADQPGSERTLSFSDITSIGDVRPGDIVIMPDLLPATIDAVDDANGFVVYNEDRLTGRGPTYARQLEIPAVIDCPAITSVVETGDKITVDGDSARVICYD
jgi:phosphoenolpyruvate synthase/pyruvate phosphate dikinase